MRSILFAIFLAGLLTVPAAAQETAWRPAGGLAGWLGLEPGRTLAYRTDAGETACVKVGRPTEAADGSRWLPLLGLAWPGLPSDSGIFLPLAGPPAVGVVWTPGPGPWRIDPLVPAPAGALPPIEVPGPGVLPGLAGLKDGWYLAEGTPADPERLLWIQCAACVDAGTKVWMRKGRGITAVERTTIAETRTLTLTDADCAVPGLEIRLEVDPAPERGP